MSTMTYEEATDKAIQLHKQGMTYPKIEEALRTAGYTSARTKKPVGALAIRHMVTQVLDKDKKVAKKQEKEAEILVAAETERFEDVVDAILSLDAKSVKDSTKMKMINLFRESRKRNSKVG